MRPEFYKVLRVPLKVKTHLKKSGLSQAQADRVAGWSGLTTPQGDYAWAGEVLVVKTGPLTTFPRHGQLKPGGVQLGPVEPARQGQLGRARTSPNQVGLSHYPDETCHARLFTRVEQDAFSLNSRSPPTELRRLPQNQASSSFSSSSSVQAHVVFPSRFGDARSPTLTPSTRKKSSLRPIKSRIRKKDDIHKPYLLLESQRQKTTRISQ